MKRTLFESAGLIETTIQQIEKNYKPKPYNRDGEDERQFLTLVHRYSYHNEVKPEQIFLIIRGYKMPNYQEQTELNFETT